MMETNRSFLRGILGSKKAAEVEARLSASPHPHEIGDLLRGVPPERLDDLDEKESRTTTAFVRPKKKDQEA